MASCAVLKRSLPLNSDDEFIFQNLVQRLEKLLSVPNVLTIPPDLGLPGIDYPPEFVTAVINFFNGDVKKAQAALQNLPSEEQKPANSGSMIACMRQAIPGVSDEDLELAFILAHYNFIEGIKLLQTPKSDRIPCENPPPSLPKSLDEEDKLLEAILPEEMRCPNCHKMMGLSREPFILFPCGHTVCSCCCRYVCPICKQKIKESGKNYITMNVIESMINHELIDQCMECQICIETYNSSTRKPVTMLPCGHTLCNSCLQLWGRSMCPFCRHRNCQRVDNHFFLQIVTHQSVA